MTELVPVLLALVALLIGVSLLAPLAERVRLPYAVLLVGLGILLGLADLLIGLFAFGEPSGGRLTMVDNLFDGLRVIGLGADGYLYLFLPPLLFSAGLGVDVRLLLDEVGAVLLLAVVAVAVAAGMIGFALYEFSERGLVVCLLLGAIVATTDPSGVIAIFRDLGAPRRLTVLVAGESLFNDAAAIALFALLLTTLVSGVEPDAGAVAIDFLVDFGGGLALGVLLARLACLVLPYLREMPIAAITFSVGVAYLSFILGEDYVGVSGVVAVVTAALVFSVEGPLRLSPGAWSQLSQTWDQLDFWATSLVFVLASMLGVRLLYDITWDELGLLGVLIVAALAARALVLEGLLPVLVAGGLARPLGRRTRAAILWGGLRGAATLVLALSVVDNPVLSPEVRRFVGVLATGYVFFTLFVPGTTLRPLVSWLKLDRLSPTEAALRDRVMALSSQEICRQVCETAERYGFDRSLAEGLGPPEEPCDEGAEEAVPISPSQRLEVGLRALANREKELYLGHFQDRSLSRGLVGRLAALADRLLDAVKVEGAEGYRRAGTRPVFVSNKIRLATALQRRLGWSAPLAEALSERFEQLLAIQLVLRELEAYNRQSLGPLLGSRTREALAELLAARRSAVDNALAAVDLQYPGFAQALRRRYLARAALRLEEAAYRGQLEESVITREVFADLMKELQARHRSLDRRPSLDLGLRLTEMIRRVPLFRQINEAGLAELGRMLRARLVHPGERIVAKGARDRSMYFIASGEVEVRLPDQVVVLRPGDFFGELALLTRQPRSADVVARGYCHLLALEAQDFRRLARHHPVLREQIERIAAERAGEPVKAVHSRRKAG